MKPAALIACLVASLAGAAFAGPAAADYPQRAITLVVPYAAGAPTTRCRASLASISPRHSAAPC